MNIQVKAGFSVRQANVIPLIVTLFLPGVPVKLTDLSILFLGEHIDLSNCLVFTLLHQIPNHPTFGLQSSMDKPKPIYPACSPPGQAQALP